jgi:chromosome segregation ATPase
LSADFLTGFSELENKIDVLLQSLEEARDESARLKQSGDLHGSHVSELESRVKELEGENEGLREENGGLKAQLEALEADLSGEREKVSSAAERVKGLLAKLDA